MKVISLGTGQKIFEENSEVRRRMISYGKIFEGLHLIVFTPDKPEFQEQKISENVFLYPTRTKIRTFYLLDYLRIIKKIIKEIGQNETVLTTQDPFETGLSGLVAKFLYKLPLQIQVHTDFANKYFILHSFSNIIRFGLAEIVLSFADSVRVVSRKIATSVHNLPEHIKVLPIYTGVESRKPQTAKDSNTITFLTVARLEKEKDLTTAIKAFSEVPNAKFVIVGDGSERENLEDLAKSLNLESKIHFAGWQNDLGKYYEEADVYISTSLYEGYGMSLVEAALNSLPIISTDTGVAGELEAFICKQKDEKAFGLAMQKLALDKPLRLKMGERARAKAEETKISYEEYLEKYKEGIKLAQDSKKENLGIFKKNILLRYVVAGLLGAGANLGMLFIFNHYFGIFYLHASILAFILAIAVSFTLQKFWTFGNKELEGLHSQFGRYMAVATVGLIINSLLMYILVSLLGVWYILAQIITNAFIAIFNFLSYKFLIFHKNT